MSASIAHPRIRHPQDLREVRRLTCRREREATSWKYLDEQGEQHELALEGALSSNNGELLRLAAMGGMGIALLCRKRPCAIACATAR